MTDLTLPPGLREVHNRYILPSFVERTSYGVKESNPYNKMFEERSSSSACRSTTPRPTT